MLLGTSGASLLGSLLTGTGVMRAGEGLMLPHLSTNFEIQKHYQNEPKLNYVYSKTNSTKIKNGVYVINIDENKSTEFLGYLCLRMVKMRAYFTM